MWQFCIDRHVGKNDGVFIDGSTKRIGLKALWRPRLHREWPATHLDTTEWPGWMANMTE